MKWLLWFVIFQVSDDGMEAKMTGTKVHTSEAACNAEGRTFRDKLPELPSDHKSLTVCIPESAFHE